MLGLPQLSICIPTYQNPAGVATALEELARQAAHSNITSLIEICVSDNSDTEETKKIVERYMNRLPRVHYRRNEHNIGYDRNVDAVLNMANGTFCWLLSDNDRLKPEALTHVFEAASSLPHVGHIIIAPSEIPAAKVREYDTLEEAIRENEYWIPGGLVSRNVFLRAGIPANRSMFFGNDWLHLSLAFEIGRNHKVRFIGEQFVMDPAARSAWAKDGKTFETYTNLLRIIRELPMEYSDEFKYKMIAMLQQGLPRQILSAKLHGLRCKRPVITRLWDVAGNHPLILFASFAALLLPVTLIRYGKKIRKTTRV